MKSIMLIVLATTVIACGGSKGSKDTPAPVVPAPAPLPSKVIASNAINAFDDSIDTLQAVELFLYYPQDNISNITWTQTSGESIEILTPHHKAISFTPLSSGEYSFEVSFESNGETKNLIHDITVSNSQSKISARLGHVVSEGNKVSLRAHFDSTLSIENMNWIQTSGPTATLTDTDSSGKSAIFFDAPAVTQDTFVTFEATISDGNIIHRDTVAVLIENKATISSNALFDERVADTFAYNTDSLYKNHLENCIYNNSVTSSTICKLNQLPLIAHDTLTPSVDDIMDRVVVSHKWMGDRFKTFLEDYDINNDLKNLLRATTAIVISYDVRPSFYWAATGAIYLDADNFWLTPDERDTLNEAPDYRAAFGKELQFAMPWRYVRDNDYLSTYITEDTRTSRDAEDGVYRLLSLMYHELAHANDFFPKSGWSSLDRTQQIYKTIPDQTQSNLLQTAYPLNGSEMYSLAQVRFHGEQASNTQKSYMPEDVSQFFSSEEAPQFYNYSSIREDYAMLFDGFMMKARYNIDRDVAITNQPDENASSQDYIVNWGQRGRISEEAIKPRVLYVTQRILPEFTEAEDTLNNLPAPIEMEQGKSWIENLDISPSSAPKSLAKAQVSALTRKAAIVRPINEFTHRFIEKPLPDRE
jgi:hypothetical protein